MSIGVSVISTAGRNPRSLTSVRADNSISRHSDTVSDGEDQDGLSSMINGGENRTRAKGQL